MTGPGVDSRFRFPRSARLLTAADFKGVFARPQRSADAFFTVLAIQREGQPARLGLAIAKKQVRLATRRNRLKRLVRETFREHRGQLVGLDLVVMARNSAATADNRRLRSSLQRHFRKLMLSAGR